VFEWCEGEIHPLVAEVRVLTAPAYVMIRIVSIVLAQDRTTRGHKRFSVKAPDTKGEEDEMFFPII
jgi:hypothetical protein